VLRSAGVPAHVAYGVRLGDRQRHSAFAPLLEVWDGRGWQHFDPITATRGLPESFFIWWRGDRPLIEVSGARNPEVSLWVQADLTDALSIAERRAELAKSRVVDFSLLSLPLETQAVYQIMLLIPIGAFLMVVLRNIVGFKSFGTFMPVLVSLSFRETELVWGLVLFTFVAALGLALRFYLERLHLLVVPRVAAVLTIVVMLMLAISVLSDKLELHRGLSVALFPLVILTMAIERLSIAWEERGPREALEEGFGSLAVAAICYLVMSLDEVEYLVFVFPELLLVVLAATLLLGRYRGYRLTELLRFRAVEENA
jgi:7 transmembrane helices usually fused to an inactive transglutaminase